jgi:hypothetical protein
MTRLAILRAHFLAVALVALAILAAGCGGGGGGSDETKSTTEWADGVCSAINTWTDSIRTAGQSLSSGNLSKESLKTAASDVQDATKTLKDDLDNLGKPDTDTGDKAKESIDELSSNIGEGVDKIENTVKGASGANEALTAITTVGQTLQTMGNQVKSTVNELEQLDPGGELDQAFKNASSCSSLRTGQG